MSRAVLCDDPWSFFLCHFNGDERVAGVLLSADAAVLRLLQCRYTLANHKVVLAIKNGSSK